MSLGAFLAAARGEAEAALERTLPPAGEGLADAMRYSTLAGGKRLRPALALAVHDVLGGSAAPRDEVAEAAAALELVHTYSLIHDDLPCMDDDDMRRGRPTVHRAFDVPVATATGLAMVPLAAWAGYRAGRLLGLTPREAGAIVRELMKAAGGGGMIGGQLLDLEAEGRTMGLEELERIHRGKTGALIEVSVRMGAMAAP